MDLPQNVDVPYEKFEKYLGKIGNCPRRSEIDPGKVDLSWKMVISPSKTVVYPINLTGFIQSS